MLCDPISVDLQNLSMKEHLTSKEVQKMTYYWKQPYRAQRIHHRKRLYKLHLTFKYKWYNWHSFSQKRLTYLKEFYTGLDLPGFRLILKSNSELLKPVFVGQVEEVDVNFLLLLA